MALPTRFEIHPERFGRYVLLDRIGVGGMAEVFRAIMPGAEGFRQTFVVKRILAERAKSPYFVDMFVQEARINARLHHPNIVQVFDFGKIGGNYFLAMEYVRGRDVSVIMRRLRERERPCPVGVAAFIAREVAQALAYAHSLTGPGGEPLNIVHRDVSPSNIICLRAGGVKLLDFGIAKSLAEPDVEKTGQGMFKGKISYVAPERIRDLPLDGRSDLFSLGVVLWELLIGRKLFRGKGEFQTLKNVLELPVPPPSTLRSDAPPELDRIIARMLARDPAERYPDGRELAEDLDALLMTLRYQTRALPELLHELFGAELASRQIPDDQFTSGLLADCATDSTSNAVGGESPSASSPACRSRESIGTRATADVGVSAEGPLALSSRCGSWVVAAVGTAALAVLLFGRGGGARSAGATLPSPAIIRATKVGPSVSPTSSQPVVAVCQAPPLASIDAGAAQAEDGKLGDSRRPARRRR